MTGQSVKGKKKKEGWKVGLGEDIIMMQDKVEDPGRCFLFPQQGVDRVQRVREFWWWPVVSASVW